MSGRRSVLVVGADSDVRALVEAHLVVAGHDVVVHDEVPSASPTGGTDAMVVVLPDHAPDDAEARLLVAAARGLVGAHTPVVLIAAGPIDIDVRTADPPTTAAPSLDGPDEVLLAPPSGRTLREALTDAWVTLADDPDPAEPTEPTEPTERADPRG